MSHPTVHPARFPNEYGQTPETLAETMTWQEVVALITPARNYLLATTRADGAPYLRPVDGVFIDDVLCFGGSPETRWVRHLGERPAISVSLPDDDHAVVLDGTAVLVTDPNAELAKRLPAANREKYPQYFSDDTPDEFLPFWTLAPERVYAWSLTGFPNRATRFDF